MVFVFISFKAKQYTLEMILHLHLSLQSMCLWNDLGAKKKKRASNTLQVCGGGNQIWTGGQGFADLCLTTWLCRQKMERKTRFELATLALARRCSTTEPFPHMVPRAGIEPATRRFSVYCSTDWAIWAH